MTEEIDRPDWTLAEYMEAFRGALQNELHTALVGRIESYDASRQTADVRVMQKRALTTNDGGRVFEQLPILRRVPVVQLRATVGGWFVHMPIAAGDEVVLFVLERDYQRWRQTGDESVTPDTRLHHLANAIAYPGLPSSGNLLASPPADKLVIGQIGGIEITISDGGIVEITGATEVRAGGTARLAEAGPVLAELAKIQATLLTGTAGGSPVNFATAYTAPSTEADIGTDITRGD